MIELNHVTTRPAGGCNRGRLPVHADAQLDALRTELQELKPAYETRLQALEARLQQAETGNADAATKAEPTAQAPARSGFNPDISLILQGRCAKLDDIGERHISGFMPAGCERRWPQIQEALIGSTFVVAASAAVLLLAGDPHGGEHLAELLTGQILWATSAQAMQIAALYSILLAFMAWRGERLGGLGFYLVFALAITASVQVVGVYLVFASLILPALAVRGLSARPGLLAGWTVGALAYAAGLAASALLDWPTGPAIVIALAVIALLAGRTLRVAASGGQR